MYINSGGNLKIRSELDKIRSWIWCFWELCLYLRTIEILVYYMGQLRCEVGAVFQLVMGIAENIFRFRLVDSRIMLNFAV